MENKEDMNKRALALYQAMEGMEVVDAIDLLTFAMINVISQVTGDKYRRAEFITVIMGELKRNLITPLEQSQQN